MKGNEKSETALPSQSPSGFRRIVIEDEEGSDEEIENENGKAVVNHIPQSATKNEEAKETILPPIPPSVTPVTPPPTPVEPNPKLSESQNGHKSVSSAEDLEKLKNEGNLLMQKKKYSEAIAVYSACLQGDPTYLPALNNRAQAYLARKEYPAAIIDCCSVLTLEPRNCKALFRRAQAYHASAEGMADKSDRQKK